MNPHVDESSMMMYLSQFPDYQLKDASIPIKARADPGKVRDGRTDGCLNGTGFSVGQQPAIVMELCGDETFLCSTTSELGMCFQQFTKSLL